MFVKFGHNKVYVVRILSKKTTTNALARTTIAVTKMQGGTKASGTKRITEY